MADAGVTAGFQQVEEAVDVAAGVGARVLQRVAHAGLGRHVDHDPEAVRREQRVHRRGVGEVAAHEGEAGMRR